MKIIKQEKISHPGRKINEDIATISYSSAWVLDGATGLNKKNLVHKDSDAKWFVEWWNEYLLNNIMNIEIDLKQIIKKGISSVKEEYYSLVYKQYIEPIDLPSSGLSLIRWMENKIEYLVLGDCTFMIKGISEEIKEYKDNKLEKLDSKAISYMNSMQINRNLTVDEAREKTKDILIRNRLLSNTEEGYWILGFNEDAADNSIYGIIDVDENNEDIEITLTSDGFSAIINNYKYIDKLEFFEILKETSLEGIYKNLRLIEEEDESCIKYPRLKKSDDSSAIYIKLAKEDKYYP